MSDQGKWFKVWASILTDSGIQNMELEGIGRWCLFGAYMKLHGEGGILQLNPPERILQTILRVDSFDALEECLRRLPNVTVDTSLHIVTVKNWYKFQVDSSIERVRKHRLCNDVRGEERRRDKKRREENKPPFPPDDLLELWNRIAHPNLPRIKGWAGSRKSKVISRALENGGIQFWEETIKKINSSNFLTGQVNGKDGQKPFRCSFDWILEQRNLQKIVEGNYDNGESHATRIGSPSPELEKYKGRSE